jgi:hypothetical protein
LPGTSRLRFWSGKQKIQLGLFDASPAVAGRDFCVGQAQRRVSRSTGIYSGTRSKFAPEETPGQIDDQQRTQNRDERWRQAPA